MTDANDSSYPLPPTTQTADGDTRRVGFELEFSGIPLDEASDAVRHALSARVTDETHAETKMEVDGLGEFAVELDWQFLKRRAAEVRRDNGDESLLELVSQAAAMLVPVEVVCPPVPVDRLEVLDPMVAALRRAGAIGTDESMISAYGVHINTEVPALDSATLHRYLQAYALLQWWLVDAHDVVPARRLSPYVDLYPEDYLHRVLMLEDPDMETLFDDYLEYNDTRNRALDLLPILKQIDAARIERDIDDDRVNARPAFHYRLPNCNIERPGWTLAPAWNLWLVVERLAERPDDIRALARKFDRARRPVIGVKRRDWVEYLHKWLIERGLV